MIRAAPPDIDTIVAAATPPGRGGVAIVRISGPKVPALLPALLGAVPAARAAANPRLAVNASFCAADGSALDDGLALYFPAPHSYTGEHVLELHGHGGPVPVEALVRRALELGARRALPGEFTQRAYLNEKLDLAQAEAVASLIDAASDAAARAALRSLQGELSRRVLRLSELIGALRAAVEAAIDFADEHIEFLSDAALQGRLEALALELQGLQRACRQGRLLTEGMTVVITGRPNAGKSTLLNRLAGYEAAIVTALPGTTRDVLREHLLLDGLPLHVLDTAGLRPVAAAADSATAGVSVEGAADAIEAEGIRRARSAMAQADRILFVLDAVTDPAGNAYRDERAQLPPGVPVTLVLNKIDRAAGAAGEADGLPSASARPTAAGGAAEASEASAATSPLEPPGVAAVAESAAHAMARAVAEAVPPAPIRLSALTGAGVDRLVAHLKECMGFSDGEAGVLSARARHVEALARVEAHLAQARAQLQGRRAPELVADELRRAQQALGEIVGAEDSDELLGRIFSTFCIGK